MTYTDLYADLSSLKDNLTNVNSSCSEFKNDISDEIIETSIGSERFEKLKKLYEMIHGISKELEGIEFDLLDAYTLLFNMKKDFVEVNKEWI